MVCGNTFFGGLIACILIHIEGLYVHLYPQTSYNHYNVMSLNVKWLLLDWKKFGLWWFNTTFNNIFRPVAIHWQTLSLNVVSSTHRHNIMW